MSDVELCRWIAKGPALHSWFEATKLPLRVFLERHRNAIIAAVESAILERATSRLIGK